MLREIVSVCTIDTSNGARVSQSQLIPSGAIQRVSMVESIVLGLDGANWDLLKPWLEDGDLPNISSLRDSGVSADLESCLPGNVSELALLLNRKEPGKTRSVLVGEDRHRKQDPHDSYIAVIQ